MYQAVFLNIDEASLSNSNPTLDKDSPPIETGQKGPNLAPLLLSADEQQGVIAIYPERRGVLRVALEAVVKTEIFWVGRSVTNIRVIHTLTNEYMLVNKMTFHDERRTPG